MARKLAGAVAFMIVSAVAPGSWADCAPITASEVMAAEMQRYAAQTGDAYDALEQIIGDDLVYVHSSAVVDNKASYIESMRSGTVKYRTMRLLDSRVRIFDCLALMTGSARFDLTVKGQDVSVELRFTEGWAKRFGRLEFVSWQSTRIAQ